MPLPGPPAEKDPPPPHEHVEHAEGDKVRNHNYQGIIGTVPGVHALARAAGGEGPAAPHEHVEHAEGDEFRVLVAHALQAQDHVAQRHRRQVLLREHLAARVLRTDL
jgi:hypothetical protein